MKNNSKYDSSCLHEEAVKWLQEIAYRKINGNTNLMELLAYRETSLWWYLDLPLYYCIKNFLREQKSTFSGSGNTINRYLDGFWLLLIRSIGVLYLLIKTSFRFLYGTILNFIAPKNRKGRYTVLVPSSSLSWRKSSALRRRKGDEMVGNVIEELLNQEIHVVAVDIHASPYTLGFRILREKKIFEGYLWKPLESYFKLNMLPKIFAAWMDYRHRWKRIKRKQEFHKLFFYQDLQVYPMFKKVFEKFFGYDLLNTLLQIELIKQAIIDEKADLVLTNCDHCTFGRSTVIAGKEMNIPTLSVQMAIITPNSREYNYTKNEIHDILLPDIIAVTGEYYKNLLTKQSAYPEHKVVVVGQPRYDLLSRVSIHHKGIQEKFSRRNNINTNKKIILVTTFPVSMESPPSHRDLLIGALIRSKVKLPNVQFVIKPHPREDERYYNAVIKKNNEIFYCLNKWSYIYEALFTCDLLVTYSSTTALEAMVMDKPVVIVDLTNGSEGVPYVQSGAAIGVYKEEDLVPAINEALYNEEVRKELAKARKKFVYDHTYIQDGNASKRTVNLIIQMIKESKRSEI